MPFNNSSFGKSSLTIGPVDWEGRITPNRRRITPTTTEPIGLSPRWLCVRMSKERQLHRGAALSSVHYHKKIWYHFKTSVAISKIGFSPRMDNWLEMTPKKVVGLKKQRSIIPTNWDVLSEVKNAHFTELNQAKAWLIPREFWKEKFYWFELNIHPTVDHSNHPDVNACSHLVQIWKERK